MPKNKNKLKNLRKRDKKRREKSLIEMDLENAPDPERRREYLKASIERLEEYSINIKRDRNDPKWEFSSYEEY